jgi:AhpD family alkylhydroperoxidase
MRRCGSPPNERPPSNARRIVKSIDRRFVMTGETYPKPTRALAEQRRDLAPEAEAAFQAFSKTVFKDGALPAKTKQLIAVAVAHVTQCPYCITGHTKAAQRAGATPQELMEAVWVAAEMRAGGAFAHANLMLSALEPAGHGAP